jgi:hypothetical protein
MHGSLREEVPGDNTVRPSRLPGPRGKGPGIPNAVLKPAQVPVRLQAGAGCGCGAGANTEVSQRYA